MSLDFLQPQKNSFFLSFQSDGGVLPYSDVSDKIVIIFSFHNSSPWVSGVIPCIVISILMRESCVQTKLWFHFIQVRCLLGKWLLLLLWWMFLLESFPLSSLQQPQGFTDPSRVPSPSQVLPRSIFHTNSKVLVWPGSRFSPQGDIHATKDTS